jgi:hypothetical protein
MKAKHSGSCFTLTNGMAGEDKKDFISEMKSIISGWRVFSGNNMIFNAFGPLCPFV